MPAKKKKADASRRPLASDPAPDRKPHDSFIIEDEGTRRLLKMLLGSWAELDPLLSSAINQVLNHTMSSLDAKLGTHYGNADYYASVGKVERTASDSAFGRMQVILGDQVRTGLFDAINKAIEIAIETETDAREASIKAARKKRKSKTVRVFGQFYASITGEAYHFGRPAELQRYEIERRSVEIIRAIEAGKGDKGRVATAYYGNYDLAKDADRKQLDRDYQAARRGMKPDQLLKRYAKLLNRQRPPLDFDVLLDIAKRDNSP